MADYTTDSRDIKDLLASTVERTMDSGVVQDAIYDAHPLLKRLRAGGQLKVVDGGERMRIGVEYAKNTGGGSYDDLDPLDVTRQQTTTSAFYNWKQYAYPVVISGKEMRVNKSSKTKLFGLLEQRMNSAAKSLADDIATGLYADGTANGGLDITGLAAAIETTPGTVAYAGVPITNTAWRNQVETGVGAAAVNLVPKMNTVWNKCSQGSEGTDSQPNLTIAPRDVYETYESTMQPQVRYEDGDSANSGFKVITFKGMPFIWSDFCTSGTVFHLNTNHLFLYVHSDANFSKSNAGLQTPVNQDSMITQILFMGNLLVNNRRKLGKLTGVTA